MYGIHTSFHSIGIGIRLVNLTIITRINIWGLKFSQVIVSLISYLLYSTRHLKWQAIYLFGYALKIFFLSFLNIGLWIGILIMLWIMVTNWLNDPWVESILSLTCSEQTALILGIKWLIISEWMLFFASFRTSINFRIYTPAFPIRSAYPQFSSYTYTIPFSNLIISLFPSLPIQASHHYICISIGFSFPLVVDQSVSPLSFQP